MGTLAAVRWLALVASGFLLQACASTSIEFTPYSRTTMAMPRVFSRAVQIYEADARTLVAAGAYVVGTINGYGNKWADAANVVEDIAVAAAEHGGTHFLVGASSVSVERVATGPATSTTTITPDYHGGGTASSTYYPAPTITFTYVSTAALVLFLPREALPRISPALWPVRGIHVQ